MSTAKAYALLAAFLLLVGGGAAAALYQRGVIAERTRALATQRDSLAREHRRARAALDSAVRVNDSALAAAAALKREAERAAARARVYRDSVRILSASHLEVVGDTIEVPTVVTRRLIADSIAIDSLAAALDTMTIALAREREIGRRLVLAERSAGEAALSSERALYTVRIRNAEARGVKRGAMYTAAGAVIGYVVIREVARAVARAR